MWDPAWRPGGDRLSRSLSCSTMGAGVFHGRVRDGIGCVIPAMATGPPGRILVDWDGMVGFDGCCAGVVSRLGAACGATLAGGIAVVVDVSSIGRLGPLGCMGYPTSTCGLSTWWSSTALEGDLV